MLDNNRSERALRKVAVGRKAWLSRVLPYWPRDRCLELCRRDWALTRDRLGTITIPEPVAEN